jgi:hypothetical protein
MEFVSEGADLCYPIQRFSVVCPSKLNLEFELNVLCYFGGSITSCLSSLEVQEI